jgi:hypothetical protein
VPAQIISLGYWRSLAAAWCGEAAHEKYKDTDVNFVNGSMNQQFLNQTK